MPKVYALHHPFGNVAMAFRKEQEAIDFASLNPLTIHSREGDRTEFYSVGELELPAIVNCKTCLEAGRKVIVTATDPKKYPYCRSCFYTGAAAEHQMAGTLLRFRKALPDAEVGVNHTGGGCSQLAVTLPDGTYYGMTGDDMEVSTIPSEGVGCICRFKEAGDDGTWQALVYEGYTSYDGDGELVRVPVPEAIRMIKADIRKPAPAELV